MTWKGCRRLWARTACSRPIGRPGSSAVKGGREAGVGGVRVGRWRQMQRHNDAAIVTRLARRIGIERRVTPHALRRSYITIGLLQGVPLREM